MEASNLDSIEIPAGGDVLSASLLNLVTLQWLEKIHLDLITIIRTEYAKELREDVSLFTLVPRISLSIDAMLAKYDKIPSVAKIAVEVCGQETTGDKAQVMKVKHGRGRKFYNNGRPTDAKKFCAGCFYLGNKVSANINFKHFPADCPRSSAMVALLKAEEEHDDSGKILKFNVSSMPMSDKQVPAIQTTISSGERRQRERVPVSKVERILLKPDVIENCIFRLNAVVQKAASLH